MCKQDANSVSKWFISGTPPPTPPARRRALTLHRQQRVAFLVQCIHRSITNKNRTNTGQRGAGTFQQTTRGERTAARRQASAHQRERHPRRTTSIPISPTTVATKGSDVLACRKSTRLLACRPFGEREKKSNNVRGAQGQNVATADGRRIFSVLALANSTEGKTQTHPRRQPPKG